MGSVVFNGQSVRPGKVVCVGKNYAAHIEEMASVPAENMVVFMKPTTSIGIELFAAVDEPLHYEGEICLLMQGTSGGRCRFWPGSHQARNPIQTQGGRSALGAQ
jgi:2-keto-4-pentenoate hydratase/2-oxohepta-3-ene-1,7-dioic acid hydratase in catechol pathway